MRQYADETREILVSHDYDMDYHVIEYCRKSDKRKRVSILHRTLKNSCVIAVDASDENRGYSIMKCIRARFNIVGPNGSISKDMLDLYKTLPSFAGDWNIFFKK